jgi:hypothetical protein
MPDEPLAYMHAGGTWDEEREFIALASLFDDLPSEFGDRLARQSAESRLSEVNELIGRGMAPERAMRAALTDEIERHIITHVSEADAFREYFLHDVV